MDLQDLAEVKWIEQSLVTLHLLPHVEELVDEEGERIDLPEPPPDANDVRAELEQRSGDDPRTVFGLASCFGLDPLERELLLLVFAPELDPNNRMGFLAVSELQSPDGRPTVGLLTEILSGDAGAHLLVRRALARTGRLRTYRLVEVIQQGGVTEADSIVVLHPVIRDLLLGSEGGIPGRPVRGVASEAPAAVPRTLGKSQSAVEGLMPVLVFGDHAGDRRATAAALAAREDKPILARRISPADALEREASAICELVRDAVLHDAVPVAELDDIDERRQGRLLTFCLTSGSVPLAGLILTLSRDLSGAYPEVSAGCRSVEAQAVDFATQRARWQAALSLTKIADRNEELEDLASHLASRFRLEPWIVRTAVERAGEMASGRELDRDALIDAARELVGKKAVSHARRVRPRYKLEHMVLPPSVRDHLTTLIGFAGQRERLLHEYGYARRFTIGHGLVALFSGESGTGKTMAGEVLANSLDRDLYLVDLSQLVSKWVGETEKHIDQVFSEAEDAQGVLMFDEADALFGSRTGDVSSSNDRYANMEVGYLLQRIESFRGVAVLTTNLSQNIDDAFRRRFHFQLDFPRPTPELRKNLWQIMLPTTATNWETIDLETVAHRYDFTGGNIRNALLKAVFLADEEGVSLAQKHLLRAASLEEAELGKLGEIHERI